MIVFRAHATQEHFVDFVFGQIDDSPAATHKGFSFLKIISR
jgi:hypothetical protein